jgi:hypothetical protein
MLKFFLIFWLNSTPKYEYIIHILMHIQVASRVCFLFFFFELESHYVTQAGLKLVILRPLPHECWDYQRTQLPVFNLYQKECYKCSLRSAWRNAFISPRCRKVDVLGGCLPLFKLTKLFSNIVVLFAIPNPVYESYSFNESLPNTR